MATKDEMKVIVANTAIDTLIAEGKIFSGMKIGLGTGSTALPAVKRLSEKIKDGTLKDIKAVATSFQTSLACEEWGIPLYTMNGSVINGELDLAIDGADEISLKKTLIKGGGAALLQEKIVAYNAKQFVIVADESKTKDYHGQNFALPVEFVSVARIPVIKAMEKLGAKCTVREGVKKCGPVITDNGNMIVDCKWDHDVDAAEMEEKINKIVGVVENGFFTKNTPIVFIGHSDGTVERR